MAYARDSEIPQIRTAFVQTIRVINPLKDPEKLQVDYEVPPSPTYTTYSTVSTPIHKPCRLAPQIRLTRQSIFSFVFGKIPLRAPPPTPSSLAGATCSRSIFGNRRWQPIAYLAACITFFALSIAIGMTVLSGAGTPQPSRPAGLAASTVSIVNLTQQTAILFYQEANYTLNLRITPDISNASFSSPQQLALVGNQRPSQNISLAATSFSDTAAIYHQLFYVMNSSIMFLNLTCPSTSPTQCAVTAHNTISGLSPAIASDSTIAAIYTTSGTEPSWQVFYQNKAYALSCLSFEDGAWNLTASVIGGKAVKGSDIAATALGDEGVEVLYLDEGSEMLYTVGSRNGSWMAPSQLTTQKAPSFSPISSSISLTYVPANDAFCTYYTTTASKSAVFQLPSYSTSTSTSTGEWLETPFKAGKARRNGGVASVGFEESVVVFSGTENGNIVMSRLDGNGGVLEGEAVV